jgi:hypothetical protein
VACFSLQEGKENRMSCCWRVLPFARADEFNRRRAAIRPALS